MCLEKWLFLEIAHGEQLSSGKVYWAALIHYHFGILTTLAILNKIIDSHKD